MHLSQKALLATLVLGCGNVYSAATDRTPQHPVDELFLNRWSPHTLSGEEISDAELMSLFEAARWAPSSYNAQPWHFIYAKRDTPAWNALFDLMVPFNQDWTKNADALMVMVSKNDYSHDNSTNRTHSFDTGAAWQNLALQASLKGLVAHGMSGFDYERARKDLNIPEGYTVEAMCAIGKLAQDAEKKETPSTRKSVEEFASEGTFKK
jgi:nitroreductase